MLSDPRRYCISSEREVGSSRGYLSRNGCPKRGEGEYGGSASRSPRGRDVVAINAPVDLSVLFTNGKEGSDRDLL